MNVNQEIKRELEKAFSVKGKEETKAGIYRTIAKKLNVHPERVRKHHRMMQITKSMPNQMYSVAVGTTIEKGTYTNNEKGTIDSTLESDFDPKDDIELAKLHKIDLTKYKINSYWSKQSGSGKFTTSVNAGKIKVDTDLVSQKNILLEELKETLPYTIVSRSRDLNKIPSLYNCLLEIAIPDIHFGKMAHAEESGEDYDLKIAGERFKLAIDNILQSVNLQKVERILFPIGNDMFNVDNMQSMTTGGTPQDTDTRFHKMVKYVKNLLIEELIRLSTIAPVDVVVVPGNHDEQSAFMLGEILDAYFHKDPNINIFNSPKLRKYYQYGNTSILLTHGDKEKHANLGMIFAAEEPKLWAATKYRFVQLGHYHHNKKINYLSNDEFQGFQIQILPSLSPNDKWHYGKGFISLKQAKGFLFDSEKGLVAEYTYTI